MGHSFGSLSPLRGPDSSDPIEGCSTPYIASILAITQGPRNGKPSGDGLHWTVPIGMPRASGFVRNRHAGPAARLVCSVDGQSRDELDETPRVGQGGAVAEADQGWLQGGDPAGRAAILGRVGGEEA